MDISHHQKLIEINWAKAAKEVDLCIIRVQYGSKLIDREYKTEEYRPKDLETQIIHEYAIYGSISKVVNSLN